MRTSLFISAFAASLVSAVSIDLFKVQQPLNDLATPPVKVPGNSPVMFCGDPSQDLVTIEYVNLDPPIPQRGQNLTIDASGTVKQTIEDGAYVKVTVKYGLIKLIDETMDFCKYIKEVGEECPLEKGPMKIHKEVELPKQIPPGKFTVVANVFTKDDDLITCITAQVVFPRPGQK